MERDHVLLYDGDCGFCRWSLDKLLSRDRDRRVRPVPLQSAEAEILLKGMDSKTKMASWHLVEPNGDVSSGGAAIPKLLRLFPHGEPLAKAANLAPPLTGIAYRLVARNRTLLGRLIGARACSVDPGARVER